MGLNIQLVPGPKANEVSRSEAEKQLKSHPQFPKNASAFELSEVDQRWVAAIVVADDKPAFFDDEKPESDDSKSEEEIEVIPNPDEDKDLQDILEGEDKSDSKDDEDSDKGDNKELGEILDLLHQVVDALGIAPEDSSIAEPGGEDLPLEPPAPKGESHAPAKLKPGELPNSPGVTPIGAPSFSSIREDHPWKDAVGSMASFTLEEEIGDISLGEVEKELKALASEVPGYEVKRLTETTKSGKRTAKAIISSR